VMPSIALRSARAVSLVVLGGTVTVMAILRYCGFWGGATPY
jgi:hypothetical protein